MSRLQSNTRPARRGAALHRLESRQLLSASPAIVDGVLQIVGTAGADVISVALGRNGRVHASVNGATTQFKLGKVHGVSVEAGAGEDRVVVSLAVPTTLVGGAGDDVLVSSAGNDLLSGGKGYDQLFPGYGSDRVELGENSPAATPPADLLASLGSVTTLPAVNLGASSAQATGGSATIDGNVNFDDMLRLAANYNTSSKDWYTGDFNADNAVNFDDLLTLAANYNFSTGADWSMADFDGSGTVNFDDLLALAAHYNQSVPAGSWALALTAVPEPGAVACATAMTLALRRGRRAV